MKEAERNELLERIYRHDVLEDGEEDVGEPDDVSEEDVWLKGFEEETMKG